MTYHLRCVTSKIESATSSGVCDTSVCASLTETTSVVAAYDEASRVKDSLKGSYV